MLLGGRRARKCHLVTRGVLFGPRGYGNWEPFEKARGRHRWETNSGWPTTATTCHGAIQMSMSKARASETLCNGNEPCRLWFPSRRQTCSLSKDGGFFYWRTTEDNHDSPSSSHRTQKFDCHAKVGTTVPPSRRGRRFRP